MTLESTGKATGNRKLNIVMEVLLALVLGGACFFVFVTMFDMKWSPGSMMSGGLSKGLAGVWDKIADALGSTDYLILPKFQAETEESGEPVYGLALTIILVAFTLISYLIIKARSRLLLLIFAVPLAIAMLFFGLTPSVAAGAAFACAIIIMLAVMNMPGDLAPKFFIVPAAMLLIGLAVLFAADRTVSLTEPSNLAKYGESVKTFVDNIRYGSDPLPGGNFKSFTGTDLTRSRGNITTVKTILGKTSTSTGFGNIAGTNSEWEPFGATEGQTDTSTQENTTEEDGKIEKSVGNKTALKVSMSKPDSYYMRGFIGAEYDKNRWKTLDNDTFYSMRDIVFWMNRRDFDGLSELSRAAEISGFSGSSVSGSTSDGGFNWPETAGSGSYSGGPEKNKIKVTVKSASRRYAFTPYEMVLTPAKGDDLRASEMALPANTRNYGGSHLGNYGIGGQSKYSYTASENITGAWTTAVGKLYTTPQSTDLQSFFVSESHYNVLQYENYLDVPGKYENLFTTEVGPKGDISDEHAEYKDTMDVISGYLTSRYTYSEMFSKPSGKEDAIETFIKEKRGCDVHYASLATLLFRYYGIPARYVEGYLITPDMVSKASGTIDVPKAASHAWTEIYIDGFGWIPFEATPEYSGIMKEADLSIGLQNVEYEYTPSEEDTEDDSEESEVGEEQVNKLRKRLAHIFRIILILLLLAVIGYAAYRIGKIVMAEMKWKKAFKDDDPGKAVRALYQYSHNHGWTLSEEAESIGLAASYSQNAIQEADRTTMQAEFDKAKVKAKEDRKQAKADAKEARKQARAARSEERAANKAKRSEERAIQKEAREKEREERAKTRAAEKEERAKAREEKKQAKAAAKEAAAEPVNNEAAAPGNEEQ